MQQIQMPTFVMGCIARWKFVSCRVEARKVPTLEHKYFKCEDND